MNSLRPHNTREDAAQRHVTVGRSCKAGLKGLCLLPTREINRFLGSLPFSHELHNMLHTLHVTSSA